MKDNYKLVPACTGLPWYLRYRTQGTYGTSLCRA